MLNKKGNPVRKRHESSISHALSVLKSERYSGAVLEVYLYGSVARGDEKFSSDVDIAVFFACEAEGIFDPREIRNALDPADYRLPEVDAHVFFGNLEEKPDTAYFRNLRKDAIDLWKVC